MITTKRGRVGAPQFRLTQRIGVSRIEPSDRRPAFRRRGRGGQRPSAPAGAPTSPRPVAISSITRRKSPVARRCRTRPVGQRQGGTETSRYFASGLVKHDGGIVQGTFYDKQSLRLNLDQDVGRKLTFTIQAGATHSISDRGLVNNENNGSSYWSAFSITPSFWDLRATCPDGSRQAFCEGGHLRAEQVRQQQPAPDRRVVRKPRACLAAPGHRQDQLHCHQHAAAYPEGPGQRRGGLLQSAQLDFLAARLAVRGH